MLRNVAMTKPTLDAFFIGRALAEGIREQVEAALTQALAEVGRFDAAQREMLRTFTEQVLVQAQGQVATRSTVDGLTMGNPLDLQESLDELRAEVAQVRSQLQQYRNRKPAEGS
jgi:siroheme synthase (precorrin-2 oxidase/ferrochelatase)